jgi:preprotein translocase subunit SecF
VVDLFRGRKWDLVGLRKLWFTISALIIIPGVFFWVTRGLNYGIDFTGGGLVTYQFAEPVSRDQETQVLSKAREAVDRLGIEAQLQLTGTGGRIDQLLVRTRVRPGQNADQVLTQQRNEMRPALTAVFPGIQEMAGEMVSAVVSKELIRNAIWSVVAGCVFILFWIRLRYMSFQWSGAALMALVHDVLVLIGVFAMTGREVNSPFVAAALTVVGYSVHDTIVIFDRIRENLRLRKGGSFGETANISLLETMPRSVNTVLTTELVLIALYLLGGASLRNFTFAMIVGITIGAYSSIFNAAQLLVVFRGWTDRKLTARRSEGRAGRAIPERARTPVRSRRVAPRQIVEERAELEEAEEASSDERQQVAAAPTTQEAEDLARATRKKTKAARKRKKRF